MRVRMLVAYDGSGFHGFAAQPGQRTVAGVLAEAIEKVARHPVDLTCAGRTDRGVHAWGQVVSLDLPASVDLEALQRSLVKLCGPAIVVREIGVAAPDFDARFSATGRTYRYTVLNRPVPDPFLATTAWHVPVPLDLELLTLACDPFLGEHDFSAFCRRPKAPAGRGAGVAGAAGPPGGVDRPRGGRAALRDRGHRLLPPDGALDRRHRRRRRPRPGPRRATSGRSCGPATGRPPRRSRRPRASACGTSRTDRSWLRSRAWLIGCTSAEFARRHDLPDWRIVLQGIESWFVGAVVRRGGRLRRRDRGGGRRGQPPSRPRAPLPRPRARPAHQPRRRRAHRPGRRAGRHDLRAGRPRGASPPSPAPAPGWRWPSTRSTSTPCARSGGRRWATRTTRPTTTAWSARSAIPAGSARRSGSSRWTSPARSATASTSTSTVPEDEVDDRHRGGPGGRGDHGDRRLRPGRSGSWPTRRATRPASAPGRTGAEAAGSCGPGPARP